MSATLVREIAYLPLPAQARFHNSTARFKIFAGPVGCVAGETVIGGWPIRELFETQTAPVVDTLFGPAQAGIPFKKGVSPLFRITASHGGSVLATEDHLLLSSDGWRPVSHLAVGSRVVSGGVGHLESSLGISRSLLTPDAQHSFQTLLDCRDRYYTCLHPCGEQLRSAANIVRASFPSQVGALEHTPHCFLTDDPEHKATHIHPCRSSIHHATQGLRRQTYPIAYTEYGFVRDIGECASAQFLSGVTSQTATRPQQSIDRESLHNDDTCCLFDHYSDNPSACYYHFNEPLVDITSIEYVRTDDYFDLHVPFAEHYIAGGLIHHNSGKTSALVQEAIRLSVVNAGLPGLLGSPTYRMLEDVTKFELLKTLDLNHIPHDHRKSENVVYLRELGTPIFCRSLEEPTRLVGSTLAWFGIDEQTYTKEQSFLRLQARLRHPKAKQLCGFGACTANGFDWTYERYIGEKKTPDYEAVRATPRENIHLPSDYYDQLARSYDERFFRQEVLGEFLSLRAGTVYHAFDRQRNLDSLISFRPGARLGWALDFNYGLMCSVLFQVIDHAPTFLTSSRFTRSMEILDEICIPNATTDLACSAFVDRVAPFTRFGQLEVHVYGDSSGNQHQHSGATDWNLVRQYFSRQNQIRLVPHFEEHKSNPRIRARVNAVNAALFNAHGEVRLTIQPKCKTLIKDLERVTWAHDTHGNILSDFDKSDKLLTHVSDAMGYAVFSEFPVTSSSAGFKNDTRIV